MGTHYQEDQKVKLARSVRRRVRFDPNVRVRFARHISDYSRKEIQRTWYSDSESIAIKKEAIELVKRVKSGEATPLDHDSIRGLETRLPSPKQLTLSMRIGIITTVFEEQELQSSLGQPNPELIADMCYPLSDVCQRQAYDRAIEDYKEVTRILLEDNARFLKARGDLKKCLYTRTVLPIEVFDHSKRKLS